ncbi:MAG: DUF1194 domain-containing protein [Pseudomonadota bacterium]
MRRALVAMALACAAMPISGKACEIALVLAIDVSGSVDPQEYRLQMDGLAQALGDTTVREALIRTEAHVAVMQWSGSSRQTVTVPWLGVTSDADVDRLRQDVIDAPRAYRHFSTAIGDALATAASLLGQIAGRCRRQVIDVSGDGISNEGVEVTRMRDALVRGGVAINGLAIEIGNDGLTGYYEQNVIGGPGAFVMTAHDFEDYPRAIRRKLLRELTDPVVEIHPPFQDRPETPMLVTFLRELWR